MDSSNRNSDWPPQPPEGAKPNFPDPGAAEWRYQRYRYAIDMTSIKLEDNRRKSYHLTHGKNDTSTPQHLEDDPEDQGVQSK